MFLLFTWYTYTLTVLIRVLNESGEFRDTSSGEGVARGALEHASNDAGVNTFIEQRNGGCCRYEIGNGRLELFH